MPDRPMPALQCIIGGPCSEPSLVVGMTPLSLTAYRNDRNDSESLGIPKSGHDVY